VKVSRELYRYVGPEAALEARLKAAAGLTESGSALPPADMVTVAFILGRDKDPAVAARAGKTLDECPSAIAAEALGHRLDPLVIRRLVEIHGGADAVAIMAALNPATDDATLALIAETGPAEVIAVFEEERERLVGKPFLLDAIRKNPLASKTVVDALSAFAAEARGAPSPAAPPEAAAGPEPEGFAELKDHAMDKAQARADEHNVYRLIASMTVSQKVKLAITGNKSAREVLVKDSNKLIFSSVLKNPRITEDEVLKLATSKSTPEDILREIARNKEWIKNYNLKCHMVVNPKTPLSISVKLLDFLYDKDLDKIAKSKNVPSVLASTARRKVALKSKR
jgi:hypothetical protein